MIFDLSIRFYQETIHIIKSVDMLLINLQISNDAINTLTGTFDLIS